MSWWGITLLKWERSVIFLALNWIQNYFMNPVCLASVDSIVQRTWFADIFAPSIAIISQDCFAYSVCQSTLSIMAFAVVFCVAMLNPKVRMLNHFMPVICMEAFLQMHGDIMPRPSDLLHRVVFWSINVWIYDSHLHYMMSSHWIIIWYSSRALKSCWRKLPRFSWTSKLDYLCTSWYTLQTMKKTGIYTPHSSFSIL